MFSSLPKESQWTDCRAIQALKKKYRSARTYPKKITGSAPEFDEAEKDSMLDVIPKECPSPQTAINSLRKKSFALVSYVAHEERKHVMTRMSSQPFTNSTTLRKEALILSTK